MPLEVEPANRRTFKKPKRVFNRGDDGRTERRDG